jgi:hypothetical protein
MMAGYWLLCDPLTPFKLDKAQMVLGRDDCEIKLPHKTVSRKHAVIKQLTENRYVICDLASSNGTFVNGKRVTRHILKLGDEIQVGNYKLHLSDSSKEFSDKTDFFTASKQFSVVGQIEKTSLIEILQSIEFHKKTGQLMVKHEKYGDGKLIFGMGRPIAANFRNLSGVFAILEMLSLKEGFFMTTNEAEPTEAVIEQSFTTILLNFLKVTDERCSESTWFD